MDKKGTLEWEYIAAIVLVLIIVVVILLFSDSMKNMIMERGREFFSNILPEKLGQ
ncbi:MAG: hypothetical protein KKA79_09900 [Nanoarchaeota archaeon]|nr:hypothetical protein [Nanoarchaeota archaeon]MCG2718635.1 hypothetical protein [Nanoarchaeota archaeon]